MIDSRPGEKAEVDGDLILIKNVGVRRFALHSICMRNIFEMNSGEASKSSMGRFQFSDTFRPRGFLNSDLDFTFLAAERQKI